MQARTLNVHNDGSGPLLVEGSGLGSPFAIRPAYDSGDADDWIVPSGATKAFIVSYLPTEDGWHQAALTLLINEINRGGGGLLPPRTAEQPGSPWFLDVTGSGTLVPNDVLQVINYINRGGDLEELPDDAGEGESDSERVHSLDYGWWTLIDAVGSSASAVVPSSLAKTAPLDDWPVDWSTTALDELAYRTTYRQQDVPPDLETREADGSNPPDWEALLDDPAVDLADSDAFFAAMA